MYYVLWICIVYIACASGQAGPVVNTGAGQIIGVEDEFVKFLGIPYAVVDETDPFGPAKPHPPLPTPYYANKDPVVCPQIYKGIIQGNIQCLNLNIYKPNNKYTNRTLPVMVFIHGGAFREGDGNLNSLSPIFLVKKEVMVVTVNYRLGPYGFLCLEQDEYSNQGLKDQSLALKWIKKYIKDFGGDENNILLFGHSAGSAAADFHLLSNEDKIFNKVILQSALMVSPLIIDEAKNRTYLVDMAKKLGIDGKDLKSIDIIKELSNISTESVISVTKNDNFRPCVHDLIIKDIPKKNNFKDMKIIVGNTEREMVFFYNDVTNYTNMVKMELIKQFVNIPEKGVNRAENFYLKGDVKDNTIHFGSDLLFNYPIERSIRHYLRNNATLYRYVFSYDGGRNYIKRRDNIVGKGATHGDELGYLFDNADILGNTTTKEDRLVIDTITTFWTNFAKYGDPTPEELSTTAWLNVEDKAEYYMNIGSFPLLQRGYRKKEMLFWESFYKDFGLYSTGLRFAEESEFHKNIAPLIDLKLCITVSAIILRFIL